jgi:hypothetical protein
VAAVVPPEEPEPAPLDELELLVAPLLLEELLLELVVPPEEEDDEDDEDELLELPELLDEEPEVTPELLDEVPPDDEPFESLPPQAARIAANKEMPSTRAVVAGAMRCSGLFDMSVPSQLLLDRQDRPPTPDPRSRPGPRQVSDRQLPIAYGFPTRSEKISAAS